LNGVVSGCDGIRGVLDDLRKAEKPGYLLPVDGK
jgi:hypothetical protein